jgi:hypothetical protein
MVAYRFQMSIWNDMQNGNAMCKMAIYFCIYIYVFYTICATSGAKKKILNQYNNLHTTLALT